MSAGRWRAAALWGTLGLLHLVPLFWFPINNPNERVRIYMTAAMVDHGSFAIGYREARGRTFHDGGSIYDRWGYVNDKALVCDDPELEPPDCEGRLYSAKAPGSSFLAVPAYLLARFLGDPDDYREVAQYLRFFTMVLPGLLFLVFFRRYASTWVGDAWLLDLVTLGLGAGSMLLTYSHMLAGHQTTAILLFTGFALTEMGTRPAAPASRALLLALGGLATTASVVVEYPSIAGALVVGGLLLLRRPRVAGLLSFAAGSLTPAFLMGWFHASAFGAPWRTAYATLENPQFVKDIAPGFMGLRGPELENLGGSFLAPFNGMFFYAPWLVLVVPALLLLPWLLRRARNPGVTVPACTAAVAVLAFTVFISCHSLWRGGWTVGPRYMVPFVPFAGLLIVLLLDAPGGAWRRG
ncbi:MAG: hypothetical protein FJ098_16835, partial [Deltaproteobacteria bacterium]|nr:hypothetical protein [Deltaproteobacteria bacterium]